MRELIVDSFAGGGGASTGIELALGRSPDIAINHDPEALALHRMNHPETLHLPHNVWKVDPVAVTGGAPVGLLWASPDCKHFSKAKGGRPVKRSIRDLAWVVVRWARQVRPRIIILENVEEFRDWGPISEDGQPCKDRKGETFKRWEGELKRLGYRVEHRELRACDYGAPTIRKRLFLIARRDGEKIVWPKPTHGKPDDAEVIAGRKLPWRTAAGIIDWSLPCHSIFLNREEGRAVGVNRPLADATMARIARGVKRYVIDAAKPFVVRTDMASAAARNGVHGADEPVRTMTTGGSFALPTPFITKFRANSVGSGLDEPLHTVTANGENRARPGGAAPLGLVAPILAGCGGRAGQSRPRSADEPTATGTAKADVCLVAPVLTYAQQGGLNRSPEEPHSTICASAKDQNALIAGTLVQTGYGEREGQDPRALDPAAPLGTVVAGGVKHAAVAAFLAQHNTGVVGHSLEKPVSTLTAGGAYGMPQQALVASHVLNMKGSARASSGPLDPIPTICAGTTHATEVRAFLSKYYGPAIGQDAHEPLHTATTKARFGLVTVEIDGEPYVIADIGMRMLSPRELYRAQGFPDSYIIDKGLRVEPREGFGEDDGEADVIPITKTAQVRMCGNSVCPPLAHALVAANYQPREAANAAPGRAMVELPLFPREAAE
ncbi:DNA cytosine methyltransferase [Bosea sp. LjRoot90]|uniref:DNA cytosine methyltransferase n=1 Tax=Bosea sp. LjRoot90 TaxID=3342342 RepID=UPI003F5086A0